MSRSYNDTEIDLVFIGVWKIYPNMDGKNAGRKALSVLLKTGGATQAQIIAAIKIYSLESQGDEFTFKLSNFINMDHWKDYLDGSSDYNAHLAKLEKERERAIALIKLWNDSIPQHWCCVMDIDSRTPTARTALRNETFRIIYRKALDKAIGIFVRRMRENDWRSKMKLTFQWFCDVSCKRHTTSKIMEGEYGHKESSGPSYKNLTKEVSDEDAEKAIERNKKLLKEINFNYL